MNPESVNLHLILAKRYHDLNMVGPSRDEYIAVLKLIRKPQRSPGDTSRCEGQLYSSKAVVFPPI